MLLNASSVASLYERLALQRDPYLERARDVSKLTIPHLLTDEGHNESNKLYTPYQSVGSRAVASLGSKLLMALYPPNTPFFRLMVDPYKLGSFSDDPDIRTEVETTLNEIEQAVMTEIETRSYRPAIHEALKQLIIAGNCLVHLNDDGDLMTYKLDRYVVKRDPEGAVQLIILKETIAPSMLPENLRELSEQQTDRVEDVVDVYTCIHRVDAGSFEIWQEVLGEKVEETVGTYPADKLPWIALRMEVVTGQSYGYGYATSYLGDLKSLEGLSQSIVEAAAVSSKCIFLVDPASQTRARTLADAPNGAIREGRATDVTVVNMGNKGADLRIAMETINTIRERLSMAFLMHQGIQRQAERQTATEWRILAQELEEVLSGTYSLLSSEFQLPLVTLIMDRMTKQRRLPSIPKDIVHPVIVTGIEALGRGHDLQRLDVFIQGAIQSLGPEMLAQFIDIRNYLDRRAVALGLVTDGLIKTEEEIDAERQQAAMQQAMQTLGPDAMKMMGQQAQQQAPQPGG
ncbi:phage tail protein [Candidatus Pacearchaeota archaeon]|nr:phage tail protein [Candidatus Pacearchaeota archaeon]